MAILTPLDEGAARTLATAHGLPPVARIEPLPAGSVNSNFFLHFEGEPRQVFLRIYEEQGPSGVAHEWAILRHLERRGLPMPRRIEGPAPGELRVDGKPVAVFELASGSISCQAGVTPARAEAVGALLARVHGAGADLGWRRPTRFDPGELAARLATIPRDEELAPVCARLEGSLDAFELPAALPRGLTHGDLFRDNVLWEGDTLSAAIDWESAAWDTLAYDLAVALLAWCVGDDFDWALGAAMVRGYESIRPLTPLEAESFRDLTRAAAVRFSVTRITDFHLRPAGSGVGKDYRRFLMRLDRVEAESAESLVARLRSPD